MKNKLNKIQSKKFTARNFIFLFGFLLTLHPAGIMAEGNSATLSSYYSKDSRASSPEISVQNVEEKIVDKNPNQTAAEKFSNESTLQMVTVQSVIASKAKQSSNEIAAVATLPRNDEVVPEQLFQMIDSTVEPQDNPSDISFADLHFDPELSKKGEVKISDHESLLFQNDSIITRAYGNQVSLNLNDQKMICVTYSSYVLGPFIPSQDYLGTYFDTINSMKELIDKTTVFEKKKPIQDETYLQGLRQAKDVLSEFAKRAQKVREEAAKEETKTRIKDAIDRYYEGMTPDHLRLTFQEIMENKRSHWEAVMTFPSNREPGKVQNRTFILYIIRDDFAVIEVQDRDAEGHMLLKETLDYDPAFVLKGHRIKTFYLNGKIKTDHDLRYEEGIKNTRYYREFDEEGNRSRFLSETFYQDGNTKTSSDYQYLSGKKLLYKFNSDGRATHSSSEPLLAHRS